MRRILGGLAIPLGLGILMGCAPRPEQAVYQVRGRSWSIDLRGYEEDPQVVDLYRGYLEAQDGKFRDAIERFERVSGDPSAHPEVRAYGLYLEATALIDPLNPGKSDAEAIACLNHLLEEYPHARVGAAAEELLGRLDPVPE